MVRAQPVGRATGTYGPHSCALCCSAFFFLQVSSVSEVCDPHGQLVRPLDGVATHGSYMCLLFNMQCTRQQRRAAGREEKKKPNKRGCALYSRGGRAAHRRARPELPPKGRSTWRGAGDGRARDCQLRATALMRAHKRWRHAATRQSANGGRMVFGSNPSLLRHSRTVLPRECPDDVPGRREKKGQVLHVAAGGPSRPRTTADRSGAG